MSPLAPSAIPAMSGSRIGPAIATAAVIRAELGRHPVTIELEEDQHARDDRDCEQQRDEDGADAKSHDAAHVAQRVERRAYPAISDPRMITAAQST